MRIVIIGGSDAGISAALRARELESSASVTVVLADSFPNYSVCGLPFYVRGEVEDWQRLAQRPNFEGIRILTNCTAERISVGERAVLAKHDGHAITLKYDRLLIATGALPIQTEKGTGSSGRVLPPRDG